MKQAPASGHRSPTVEMDLAVRPLTPRRWADFEAVFNARGCSVARGCWCMFYRQSGSQRDRPGGVTIAEWRKRQMKTLVDAGEFIGLVGYRGRTPVGWISLGPREGYQRLHRSPVMKPVDDKPVWSIVCFVVPAEFRGQGIARALLDAGIAYAKKRGAKLLEAYPVDKAVRSNDDAMWFGPKRMFDDAGFVEVARRKPARPVVRLVPR